jgi:hypothetical protein
LGDRLQDIIGLQPAHMILDEDLSIERKMVEILSKIIYLDLSLDAMGFNHPSDR